MASATDSAALLAAGAMPTAPVAVMYRYDAFPPGAPTTGATNWLPCNKAPVLPDASWVRTGRDTVHCRENVLGGPHCSEGTIVNVDDTSLMGPWLGVRMYAGQVELEVAEQPDTAVIQVPLGRLPGVSHTLLVINNCAMVA